MSARVKNILYAIVVIGLFAPLAQKAFNIPQPGLRGAFVPNEKPVLSWESWFEGQWQEQYSSYFETSFGFRPWLILMRNHIEYHLFRKNLADIIIGKNDYLYENSYIRAYLGSDRIPFDSAVSKVEKLRYIEQYLAQKNKHILTVIAPGKGSFCNEFIPDNMHPERKSVTNYDQFSLLLNRSSVPCIDFRKWFLSIRDTSTRLLYTRFGIHWSSFSAHYVSDSIVKKMESVSGKSWGYYTTGNERTSTISEGKEEDLMDILNTLGVPSEQTYSYIDVTFTPRHTLPKVLIIGDSYTLTPIEHGALMQAMALGSQFWYYNHDVFTLEKTGLNRTGTKEKTAIPDAVNNFDFIILLNTEPNLADLGNGFIESYYKQLTGTNKSPQTLLKKH